MIAFSDSTALFIAQEPTWGTAPVGAFQALPFESETLLPERRYRAPSSLEASGTPSVVLEEMAGGDIETLATTNTLPLLLAHILKTTAASESASISRRRVGSDGAMTTDRILPNLKPKDFVFIRGNAANQGWHMAAKKQGVSRPVIEGLAANSILSSQSSITLNSYSPGSDAHSVAIYKTYKDGQDWQHLQGGMMSRLTLDLAEGTLFTASLSVLARQMAVTSTAPTTAPTTSQSDYPLGYANSLKQFYLHGGDDSTMLTQDNSVITGFRLVMERVGMAPQYALGSTMPKLILPGDLAVYGVIDLLIEDYKLFRWMNDGQSIEMSVALEDDGAGGVAFYMPSILLSGIDASPATDGEPIRVRFRFDAHGKTESATTLPMIKAFIQQSL